MRTSNVLIFRITALAVSLVCSAVLYHFSKGDAVFTPTALILLVCSVFAIFYFSYEQGYKNAFEDSGTYRYNRVDSGANLKSLISYFLADRVVKHEKERKKIIKISGRSSDTYKTFEKESLMRILDETYTLYKMSLVASDDNLVTSVRSVFSECMDKYIKAGSSDRKIMSDNHPNVVKDMGLSS
jgi:hypothetical protein